ncbi:hypothetical protein [Bacillus methanolicus]|uniref:hypothetical protein n=1 Tax=Bacillus methanolicus TaxID=1471 RepID=UPI00200D14EA|nr:hypothetical protein [Bacillus methanolicus]
MSLLKKTTKEIYYIEGQYSEERRALHEYIISTILKDTPRKDKPEAYLLGGGVASGKVQ